MKGRLPIIILTAALGISLAMNALLIAKVPETSLPISAPTEPDRPQAPAGKAVSLADAIALLPHPEQALAGKHVSGDLYWVWVQDRTKDTVQNDEIRDESWIVDVAKGSATRVSSHKLGAEGQADFSTVEPFYQYFKVDWHGWEALGGEIFFMEYIDRDTGQLAYTVIPDNGRGAEISAGTEKVEVRYAPADVCVGRPGDAGKPEPTEGMARGLTVNGRLFPFPEGPIKVRCNFGSGSTRRATFEVFRLSEEADRVIIGLGADYLARLPLPLSDSSAIFYEWPIGDERN